MPNNIRDILIRKAYERHGIIYHIEGLKSSDKSFTQHNDKHGVAWMFFWYHDIELSTHIVRQRISCPQCNNELQYNGSEHGHCNCERRGL